MEDGGVRDTLTKNPDETAYFPQKVAESCCKKVLLAPLSLWKKFSLKTPQHPPKSLKTSIIKEKLKGGCFSDTHPNTHPNTPPNTHP